MRNLLAIIVKSSFLKNRLLINILIVSVLLVATLPLFNYLVIRPSFEKFLTESTNDEASKIAKHFVKMLFPQRQGLSKYEIRSHVADDFEDLKSDFGLTKLKIYSNFGEIIFSSDSEEIGNLNKKRYFHEIVAKGNLITKGIQKETKSLEGQLMPVDVVESYVPLMSEGVFKGALEIYYDITARKKQLDHLLFRSFALAYIIASGLLLTIIVILFVENKNITERKQVEKERENLITKLQDALAKIKTLRGLLPICSSCKKIRDDKGYWNQIESYISDHSEAEFTHGICPKCAKKLYPELLND
jgi:hypothetical protein